MPYDTYAFEAGPLDSRKLNMVGRKKSQAKLTLANENSFDTTFVVLFCQRRTSSGTVI